MKDHLWGTRLLQAWAGKAVRLRSFGAISKTFARRVPNGSSGGGVEGEVNLPPATGSEHSDQGSTELGSRWDQFGITLESFSDRFGPILRSCWDDVGVNSGSVWDRIE